MKAIWKYELTIDRIQEIELPNSSEILSVGVTKNVGNLWVKVDKDTVGTMKVKILTVPTGSNFSEDATFLRTLIYNKGEIVQHVFVLK